MQEIFRLGDDFRKVLFQYWAASAKCWEFDIPLSEVADVDCHIRF